MGTAIIPALFFSVCKDPSFLTGDPFPGVLYVSHSNIRPHPRIPRIPHPGGSPRKWRITANNDVVGEEEKAISVEKKTQGKFGPKQSSGKGFGSSKLSSPSGRKIESSGGQESKERKNSPVIRRTPLEKPFAVPKGDPKVQEYEGAFLVSWAGLGILILTEGLVLAASGFLPEEWDNFSVKYLYPAFSPTVALFLAGAAAYGLYKYLGVGSQKS